MWNTKIPCMKHETHIKQFSGHSFSHSCAVALKCTLHNKMDQIGYSFIYTLEFSLCLRVWVFTLTYSPSGLHFLALNTLRISSLLFLPFFMVFYSNKRVLYELGIKSNSYLKAYNFRSENLEFRASSWVSGNKV